MAKSGISAPQDMSLKYDGRLVHVDIYINTDQDLKVLLHKLSRDAKGPKRDAVVIAMSEYTGTDGEAVWKELQQLSVQVAANPESKPFPEEE